jgi:hypothetical protein
MRIMPGSGTTILYRAVETYAVGYKEAQSGRDDPRSNPPATDFASQDASDDCR